MLAWYRRRWLDLVASIYIYNEHRGYTALDRVLEAVKARSPDDHAFIAAIEVMFLLNAILNFRRL